MLGPLLRHPAIRPLKRLTRDAWWRYKGRSIANPPLPSDVRSVLYVCLGNICRSPFAEAITALRVRELSAGPISCSSAGLATKVAAEPPVEAREVAATFGVTLDRHRPRMLTREMMEAHDIVVVMESGQRDRLRAAYPDLGHRVFLLPLFDAEAGGLERYHIADPFALPRAAYEVCYRRIDLAVSALLVAMREQAASHGATSEKRA